jgi:hypothetical protein
MAITISGTNGLLQSCVFLANSSGFSYTFPAGIQVMVITSSSTLSSGTVIMPAAPSDGMTITINTISQINTLTISPNTGQTINNLITFFPAKTTVSYIYQASNATWYLTQTLPSSLPSGTQFYRLNSNLVTANVNTAQSILGVGVTLASSTVYQFEAIYMGYKSAGTTSHSIGFGFGGTATLNNVIYFGIGNNNNGAGTSQALDAVSDTGWVNTASNTTLINNTATAAVNFYITLQGTVSVNAGGTFIPQFTLSAAPGGAYTISAGSYFSITSLSVAGANTNIGSWA